MTKGLRSVGFFRELPYGDQDGDSLTNAVGRLSSPTMDLIVSYLKSGVACVVAPGVSNDIVSPAHEIIGSLTLRTDGEYLWPSDLAHYVQKYRVSLPEEFLKHMETNCWKVPPVDISSLDTRAKPAGVYCHDGNQKQDN